NEEVENGIVEEIRAGKEDLIEEIGKSDKEWYNGVFGSADKVNSTEAEPNVSMNKIDCEKECLSDNHAISSDKMCTDENEINKLSPRVFLRRLLPHARGLKFESLRGVFLQGGNLWGSTP
ncbi:hypothetical protein Tco_1480086, partial [Tanacetum coccineum]